MKTSNRWATWLLTGASALAVASSVNAQAAQTSSNAAAPAPDEQDESKAAQATDIVVTGSRVIQNGNNSPTPVTVVSTAQLLQTTPSNIQDGLQALPILSGAQNGPQRQPGNSGGNGAAHTLNLRNVGTTRTLVLFDGRRVPPTAPTGEVDVDLIPSMLLQRVDIVTGGASAVYGSDAVTGVVNFVTDRNYNGFKINAQAGISQYGDGGEQRVGVAAGKGFLDGRLHVEGSYEFYNSPGIDSRLVRKFGRQVITMQGAGSTALPYRLVADTRLNSTSFYGVIKSGPLADQVFRQNGILSPFIHGAKITGANGAAVSGIESGGDGGYYSQASLLSMFQSHQAFGRADYDLTNDIHFYVEGVGFWAHNRNNHQDNELPRSTTISSTNAFLSPTIQSQLAGTSTFTYSKIFTTIPVLQPDTHTRTLFGNAGFEGKLGKFKWDVSYLHAESVQRTSNNHNLDNQRLAAALDAVRDPASGNIVCRVTLTNPGLYPGCVPMNVFGQSTESQAAVDYVVTKTTYRATTKMDTFGGGISGSPFATWAGDVQAAISGEYRKLDYKLLSNAQPIAADCTGLRFNCSPSTLKYISDVLGNRSPVSTEVKEAAIEVDVPLLKDVPFFQSLNVNGAGRYTDYDVSGSVQTWKLGVDWHVNDAITLRGTRSRDIRAPSINELFAPVRITPAGTQDVHTGIVGQAPFIQSSNPNLVPEVAQTWTAGVVLRPAFIPRFSLSIDWYKIKIANAITTIQGQNPTIQNICEASNGTSSFCDLIQRPLPFSDRSAANVATGFLSRPENAQTLKTNGIDFEMNYALPIGPGNLSTRTLVSYQPKLSTVQFVGAPVLNAADTPGQAKWRVTAFLKYAIGKFAVDVQERWHAGTTYNSDRTLVYALPRLPAASYTNVTFSLNNDKIDYFLSVRNVFNKATVAYAAVGGPAGVPGLQGGYVPGDDNLGRYFNVGFRFHP
jgi:iron complex outermembrane receptor protein